MKSCPAAATILSIETATGQLPARMAVTTNSLLALRAE